MAQPALLECKLEARLPLLLRFLDSYMGEEGAGRRLVRARPLLAGATVTIAQRTIGSLAARGFDKEEMRAMISKDATLLIANLASPQQRQKLDWISQVSPWALADFLNSPRYFTSNKPGAWRGGWPSCGHVGCSRRLLLGCWQYMGMPSLWLLCASRSKSRGGSCPGPAGRSGRRHGWARRRAASGASRRSRTNFAGWLSGVCSTRCPCCMRRSRIASCPHSVYRPGGGGGQAFFGWTMFRHHPAARCCFLVASSSYLYPNAYNVPSTAWPFACHYAHGCNGDMKAA